MTEMAPNQELERADPKIPGNPRTNRQLEFKIKDQDLQYQTTQTMRKKYKIK